MSTTKMLQFKTYFILASVARTPLKWGHPLQGHTQLAREVAKSAEYFLISVPTNHVSCEEAVDKYSSPSQALDVKSKVPLYFLHFSLQNNTDVYDSRLLHSSQKRMDIYTDLNICPFYKAMLLKKSLLNIQFCVFLFHSPTYYILHHMTKQSSILYHFNNLWINSFCQNTMGSGDIIDKFIETSSLNFLALLTNQS